jgi:dipeptidyl aminopeptidase/acylaminoacyl peptidase
MTRRIPLEDFFRKPERTGFELSPSGRHLAFLAPWERRLNVHVLDLDSGGERRVTEARTRDVAGFLWADDDRIVYVQDAGGDENWRLHAVSRDGGNPLDLTPFEGVQCRVVDDLEEVPGEILFEMNRRDPHVFDVYRLNVNTGAMTAIAENPGNVQGWYTDHDGRLRLATTTDGVNTSILHRESETDPWRTVATYDFRETAHPLKFTFDNRAIWVASNVGRDRRAIFEYDLATGKETRLVFEHPEVDVAHLLVSKVRKAVTGVLFETDKPRYVFFDERRLGIQRRIDERLPDTFNAIASTSRDENRWIVHATSDRTRGAYWLYDVPTGALRKLFDASPWLDETEMAEMRPVAFASRDGLPLRGYLTLPPGREPTGLPLVVNPHGGPWHRDSWGFDPEIQFLANRGFAVLQVNFRGSTGYGRRFLEASFGEWGLAMQDDVADAVAWAVAEGIADPARVAIYGGSYGGYAALSGLTKHPELYACGISYVGVSNLFTWLAAIPPYWKPYLEMMHVMVGHPERDAERFRATSPFFNAARIRVPLLVVQGANDPRVRKEESDQIVAALRERGVAVEYLVKDDEGHGFRNEENLFELYRTVEAFLERHLGEPES